MTALLHITVSTETVLIIVTLFLCAVCVCLGADDLEQRIRRHEAEDDADAARGRAERLAGDVPFPMGERLPR